MLKTLLTFALQGKKKTPEKILPTDNAEIFKYNHLFKVTVDLQGCLPRKPQ